MGLAIFARQIGLDHDDVWGASRYLLLTGGLAWLGAFAWRWWWQSPRFPTIARNLLTGMLGWFRRSVRWLLVSPQPALIVCVLLLGALNVFAVWYSSNGLFPAFRPTENPYVDLGEAFLHGQVALLETPDPRLVALADPVNDFDERDQLPYPWDISYYKGHYYAYWGPVPALVYAGYHWVVGKPPRDQWGVLAFFSALSVLLLVVFWQTRQIFFPRGPRIFVGLFLLATLLNLPMQFILTRSNAYETAIIAGQAFLFAGVSLYLVYWRTRRLPWLVLAGLAYGLAVGSRYNLVFSVGVWVALALWSLWRGCRDQRGFIRGALAFLAPLLACAALLLLYNYIRFEDPLQTGLQYQLAFPWYQKQYYSVQFFLPNLYAYLFYPPTFQASFPFLQLIPFQLAQFPAWAALPPGKTFEEIMLGVAYVFPVFWVVALLPLFALPKRVYQAVRPGGEVQSLRGPFALAAALASLCQLTFLLFYYYGAMRFYLDFLPMGMLALALALWWVDERLDCSRWRFAGWLRGLLWGGAVLPVLVMNLAGLLGGFDIPPQLFRLANPDRFYSLAGQANALARSITNLLDSPGMIGVALRLVMKVMRWF